MHNRYAVVFFYFDEEILSSFICPIIQQYAHLHEYGLEEQDSKVR